MLRGRIDDIVGAGSVAGHDAEFRLVPHYSILGCGVAHEVAVPGAPIEIVAYGGVPHLEAVFIVVVEHRSPQLDGVALPGPIGLQDRFGLDPLWVLNFPYEAGVVLYFVVVEEEVETGVVEVIAVHELLRVEGQRSEPKTDRVA